MRGGDLFPLHLLDHIGVPRQVLDRFFGNAAGQLQWQDLLHVLDCHSGTAHDHIKRGHGCLDPFDPFGIYASPYGLALQGCLGICGANQKLRLTVFLTLTRKGTQGGVSLCPKLLVFFVHKSPSSEDQ